MSPFVLGLDVGGANLKCATNRGDARSVAFPLWKQHLQLPEALVHLLATYPDVEELAVTMTGELCDCYGTKREGVAHIVDSVQIVAGDRPVRFWSTGGKFVDAESAKQEYLKVAAANWHALATFASRFAAEGVLVDVGSTTTDVIPFKNHEVLSVAKTDVTRLQHRELIYTGVRRTPLCALMEPGRTAAELFATTLDAYLRLGAIPEDKIDCDTADSRPATREFAHARISRMLGGDPELISNEETLAIANSIREKQFNLIREAIPAGTQCIITSGSGEFLAKQVAAEFAKQISLTELLGASISASAPAYAVAVLAAEQSS